MWQRPHAPVPRASAATFRDPEDEYYMKIILYNDPISFVHENKEINIYIYI